jgi:hypothetical protein
MMGIFPNRKHTKCQVIHGTAVKIICTSGKNLAIQSLYLVSSSMPKRYGNAPRQQKYEHHPSRESSSLGPDLRASNAFFPFHYLPQLGHLSSQRRHFVFEPQAAKAIAPIPVIGMADASSGHVINGFFSRTKARQGT